jgi:hypothetical protein
VPGNRGATGLAFIVFFQILRRSGATNVMLVMLLIDGRVVAFLKLSPNIR